MHWSRLVDLPLALVILPLTPLMGSANAELVALVLVPLLTLFIAIFLAARIAWRLMGNEEATLTALVMALAVPLLFQLGPLRIDHHGWQVVCSLAVINGLMMRSSTAGAKVIGASVATWMAISIEGLPFAIAIFAVLALRWLRDREGKVWLVGAIQSLAFTSVALFLLTRGWSDLSAYCDMISPVHIAMFALGALVLTLLSRIEPAPLGIVLGGFALAGGGALGLVLYFAPQCATGGGFAGLDPLVTKYWHANVLEGMPIWRQSLTNALQYAVTPLIALIAAMRLARKSRDWLHRFWSDYAIILAAALIVAVFVSRAGAVACAIAAPPLAWQLRRWLRAIRTMDRPASRIAAIAGVCCALLPALPAMLLTSAIPAQALPVRASLGGASDTSTKAVDCRVQDARATLSSLPTGEFYAPLDIGPELLLVSDHSVIATGHHRGHAAMKVVIETALGSPEDARKVLAVRGTDYVTLCPALAEAQMYARISPQGFVAALVEGDAPAWLDPVEIDVPTGLEIYRITPE